MKTDECGRFEAQGLLQLEGGLPLDPHFEECADCRRVRGEYAQLSGGLSRLPPAAPPEDWQARVWEQVEATRPRAKVRRLWPVAVPLLAAGVALVLVWPGNAGEPSLEVELRGGAQQLRGRSAQPGDALQLRAQRGGHRHAELRLYRDGVLVFRCGPGDPCQAGRQAQADLPLEAVGRYQPVLLLSDQPLSVAGPGLPEDLEQAVRRGARVLTAPVVDVY